MEKYRDVLKLWEAKTDGNAIYMILGIESQSSINYAMPVRVCLYDMIGYAKQVDELKRSYDSNRKANKDAKIVIEDGKVLIELSGDEFLSGMAKGDRLLPIITVIVYTGSNEWDGARCLHDLVDLKDERLFRYIPDAELNLVVPAEMDEQDFMKFRTSLGMALEAIKRKADGLDKMMEERGSIEIDKETAVFLENVANIKVNRSNKGDTFMLESNSVKECKKVVCALIGAFRKSNMPEDDIFETVKRDFPYVPSDYIRHVLALSDEELEKILFHRQINSIYQRFGEEEVSELFKE